jgi:hypothetical protein
MEEGRSVYKVLVWRPEGKRPREETVVGRRITLS